MDGYTVGQLAALAGVSVRTLHHYDEVGLVRPSARSAAGYRLYGNGDLERLREVLFYRELDFALPDIAAMLDDPGRGTDERLREQHRLLRERIERQQALLRSLEKQMEARDMGMSLTPEEQFELFGTDRIAEHQAEAEQRWGDTEAWTQSARRTAAYTKQDWQQIKAEADANVSAFAAALRAGGPADGADAQALAEDHRRHISRWFYDCPLELHRCLGEMYVADERFAAHYDEVEPGLAQYVRAAIVANAARD